LSQNTHQSSLSPSTVDLRSQGLPRLKEATRKRMKMKEQIIMRKKIWKGIQKKPQK
jgi:hypothetical protein